MNDTFAKQIREVASRFRSRRFWLVWCALAFTLAVVGVGLLVLTWQGRLRGDYAATGLAFAACVLFAIDWTVAQFSFRNARWIAYQIESAFPNLSQRLVTALSLVTPTSGSEWPQLGYLQSQVIREARDHSRRHAWSQAVPARGLRYGKLGGIVSTAMLAVVMALLVAADPGGATTARLKSSPTREVIVEPGDIEIERGSGLAITARFAQYIPTDVELVAAASPTEERRMSMARNLDDPMFGVFVTDTKQSFDYQVITPLWTSDRYHVEVFDYPELVRADASIEFPSYTGLSPRVVADAQRVSAVEGAQLQWQCFVNKPLAGADLVDEDGNRTTMQLADPATQRWESNHVVDVSRRWTLELVDSKNRRNKLPIKLTSRSLPNRPAQIKLVGVTDATVSPLQELPLAADVQDDFGIVRGGVSFVFGEEPETEILLAQSLAAGKKHRVDHLVDFESLGAAPDQLLSYYFWAEDIDRDGETRRTLSDLYFAEVRPFEEIYREGETPPGGQPPPAPSQNAQAAEELLELQKQIVTATFNVLRDNRGVELGEKPLADVDVIKGSQLDAAEQLNELMQEIGDAASKAFAEAAMQSMTSASEKLAETMVAKQRSLLEAALSAEQSSYQALLKLRAREFEVSRSQQSPRSPSSSASQANRQQKLDELELKNDENRYETQSQASETSEESEARETRQIMNRLKDLARRQSDLNEQLVQLQSALEQAEDEEQKEEIKRRLERLREQQEELLRETDELAERMQQSSSASQSSSQSQQQSESQTPESPASNQSQQQGEPQSPETREASEQLEQARNNVQQATEALRNQDASSALAAGTRAEQQFESLRDDFRKQAASEFEEVVKQMRDTARELEENQQQISEKLAESESQDSVGLRRGEPDDESAEQLLGEQQERLAELMNQMQETVQQAEASEPLLAEKLYESHRTASQQGIDRQLSNMAELQRRGMVPQAQAFGEEAGEGITQLREGLEEAATSVLGDPTRALERALGELDQLSRDLDAELDQQDPSRRQSSQSEQNDFRSAESPSASETQQEPNADGSPASPANSESPTGQTSPAESPSGSQPQSSEQPQANDQQPGGQQPGDQQPGDQQPSGQQPSGQQPGGQPQDADGQPSGQRASGSPGSRQAQGLRGGPQEAMQSFSPSSPSAEPIAGDGFREWTDGLRDIEEMVEQPEFKSRAAQIRDRAREVRMDQRRNSKAPQWDLVEKMIAAPLRELKADVTEELIRRSSSRMAPVPIDRDPVPDEFAGAVKRYYESLGSDR